MNDYTKKALDNTANNLTQKQKEFRADPGKWFRDNTPVKPLTTSIYDEEFLKSTLSLLQSELDDLDTWSVYNEDKFNDEISIIRNAIELIKENL